MCNRVSIYVTRAWKEAWEKQHSYVDNLLSSANLAQHLSKSFNHEVSIDRNHNNQNNHDNQHYRRGRNNYEGGGLFQCQYFGKLGHLVNS